MSAAARFELRPSAALAAAIIAGHAAAAAAAYMVMPSVMGAVLAAALLALGVATAWSRALLRSAASVRAIEIGESVPVFELASGDRLAAEVGARRYVTRYVVASGPIARGEDCQHSGPRGND
ncbi:MAG: hypothetical protein E6G79_08890 [Alphaproteobacteria bacterium]|nr:MAG: hypothetical protein E6G79_08890 [Alphaproteobacteria bacterium]